jgi:hypothetical protein
MSPHDKAGGGVGSDNQHEPECKPEMVRSENAESLRRPDHKHQRRQPDGQHCVSSGSLRRSRLFAWDIML